MAEARFKLSPPWVEYINKMEALFDGDPQIAFNVDLEGAEPKVVLACNNGDKVTALQQILPTEVTFGNIILHVIVDGTPSNRTFKTKKELFDVAFAKNPAYAYSVAPADEGYAWFSFVYVVFKCCVIQIFCDNLNDCHGIISTLYQNIAKEIFTTDKTQGVYYCTDVESKVGKTLDEWP